MRNTFSLILTAACVLCGTAAHAQDTNAPRTKLELLETQTNAVIVMAHTLTGTVFAQSATVSVICKESIDAASGRKEHGLAIGVKQGDQPEEVNIVDYDELDSLLVAVDFVSKVDAKVTELPEFDVVYRTRDEFKVFSYTSNLRVGVIQAGLQGGHQFKTRVLLSPDQLTQFKTLIQQAKGKLDQLRAKK